MVLGMKTSRVLTVLVCLALCAVFTTLYITRYVVEPKTDYPTAEVQTVEAKAQPATTPTVEYSVFPRQATQINNFTANVTGTEGEENVLDYYAFGGYVFVILHTDTNGGDYRALSPSLAVARFDVDCQLRDTTTLPQSEGYDYLCASLYDYGLMIAASNGQNVCVWAVSTNLSVKYQVFPYAATDGKMLYASSCNLLCLGGAKLYALCLSATLTTLWAYAVGDANWQLMDVYKTAQNYAVICTTATEGAAYVLSSKGFLSRSVLEAVDAITPFAGGYAVLNKAKNKLFLYDTAFGLEKQVALPKAEYESLASYDKGLVALSATAQGYTGRLLCNHGDILSTFALPQGTLLSDPIWDRDGAMVVALQQDNALQVYRYVPFGPEPATICTIQGANNAKLWTTSGYLYVACDSLFDYGVFGQRIGGRDVYLLRTVIE